LNEKIAVFLDGCFWHGCETCGHIPKKNSDFWLTKITRNKERDVLNSFSLEEAGITVVRFWEHEINKSLSSCVKKTLKAISSKKNKPI
jgi:DNA mismatch endonuclease (patch repair protein)